MRSFTAIWQRIRAHQNEPFKTIKGLPFTYAVSGNVLTTDRTDFPIQSSEFEKVLDLMPVVGPGEISNLVRGPSYVWAILHDRRIRGTDW